MNITKTFPKSPELPDINVDEAAVHFSVKYIYETSFVRQFVLRLVCLVCFGMSGKWFE